MTPQEIYQFDLRNETSLKSALVALGAALPVYARLEATEELPRAYITIEASPFTPASEQLAFSADLPPLPFRNHYSGQVRFEIQTPRNDPASAAAHHASLGLVRQMLGQLGANITIAPYEILDVQETSGSLTMIRDGERDRSTLVFDVQLGIPGAQMSFIGTTHLRLTGAGTALANGTYVLGEPFQGHPAYYKAAAWIWFDDGFYVAEGLSPGPGGLYSAATLPGPWTVGSGLAPAPTAQFIPPPEA